MTKFIFFLLNLQGYLSRLPYLLQIVEKSFLYKKVYIKIFIHFKLYYIITGNLCLVLRHPNEERGLRNWNEREFAHIYTKSYELPM